MVPGLDGAIRHPITFPRGAMVARGPPIVEKERPRLRVRVSPGKRFFFSSVGWWDSRFSVIQSHTCIMFTVSEYAPANLSTCHAILFVPPIRFLWPQPFCAIAVGRHTFDVVENCRFAA